MRLYEQAIEALDRNRVCTDYWDSRPYSRPQCQIPQPSHPKESGGYIQGRSEEHDNGGTPGSNLLPDGVDGMMLRGLLKKANPEELHVLRQILNDGKQRVGGLITLLNEEIHNRPR